MHPDMLKLFSSMQAEQAKMYTKYSEQLGNYIPTESALHFSSLLLDPDYHSTIATIEKAIHLCLGTRGGKRQATKRHIKKVFHSISSSGFSMLEDPAEDVMVAKLWLNGKDYNVLLGLWEGCIHQTQMFINVLESMPRKDEYLTLYKQVEAILIASNEIICNFKMPVNVIGNEYPLRELHSRSIKDFKSISKKLDVSNIKYREYLPVLSTGSYPKLATVELGKSDLEASPFILYKGKCFLALPTAVTTSIRRLIYSFCKENNHFERLTKGLALNLSKKLSKLRIFGEFSNAPILFEKRANLDNWLISSVSMEFDRGYHYHFIFIMDALKGFHKDWFQGFLGSDNRLVEVVHSEIKKINENLTKEGADNKVCTFIVPCGFGRGFSIGFNPENELVEVINANDLVTLSQDVDCTPYRIWRLVEASQLVKKYKAHIQNVNGFLNLYGYIKGNDFSIFNHSDFIDVDSENIYISLGTNFQKDVREKVLQDIDLRTIRHPELGLVVVQKGYPNSLFEQNDAKQMYCPSDLKKILLQAAYHQDGDTLWLEMPTDMGVELSLQAQIFNAVVYWLPKVIDCLKHNGLSIVLIDLIRIEIDFPKQNTRALHPKVSDEEVLNSCSYSLENKMLECSFDKNLLYGFSLPTNIAERALVRPFIVKICEGNKDKINQVCNEVFDNIYARHVHMYECTNYSENIVSNFENEKPITLEVAAEKKLKFGLGWLHGVKPASNHLNGKSICTTFLGKVVGEIWLKAKYKLNTLNKEALIRLLLQNIELCELHKTRWSRTFKANQYLHTNHENLYEVATKEVGLLNGASLASRLIIEMAVCECQNNNGKIAGKMDVQELQSYALSLHLLGGVSDAINFDAIEPKIVISGFGDVLYEHDFEDLIVNKYQAGLHKEKFDNSANNYSNEFVPKNINTTEKEVEESFDDVFWDAWVEEFGFTPNQCIDFINTVQDYGYTKKQLVFALNSANLKSLPFGLEDKIIDEIIQCLSLESRSEWKTIPMPFKRTDWQPWRFKRRYSLAYKPIVYLKENDCYLISPEHMRRAFFHLLTSTYDATIDENNFQSKKMISWNGSRRAKTGLQFNFKVADSFDNEYWNKEVEVKLTKILNKKLKDYGDIDVLVWHKTKNIVLAIECKDLERAKNQSEIARQLFEFKGNVNSKGKSDRLHKHIVRVEQLRRDSLGLGKYIGRNGADIQIIGMVVFSSLVPMHFTSDKADDITFSSIEKLPAYLESIDGVG